MDNISWKNKMRTDITEKIMGNRNSSKKQEKKETSSSYEMEKNKKESETDETNWFIKKVCTAFFAFCKWFVCQSDRMEGESLRELILHVYFGRSFAHFLIRFWSITFNQHSTKVVWNKYERKIRTFLLSVACFYDSCYNIYSKHKHFI